MPLHQPPHARRLLPAGWEGRGLRRLRPLLCGGVGRAEDQVFKGATLAPLELKVQVAVPRVDPGVVVPICWYLGECVGWVGQLSWKGGAGGS